MFSSSTDPNEIWRHFRLPIPLDPPQNNNNNKSGTLFPLPSYCTDEWIARLSSLLRLLHVMKQQQPSSISSSSSSSNTALEEQQDVLSSQIRLAESSMHEIETNFVPLLHHDLDNRHRPIEALEEYELNFHTNMEYLLEELRRDVLTVCTNHRRALDRLLEQDSSSTAAAAASGDDGDKQRQRDYIAEIFLMNMEESPMFNTIKRTNDNIQSYEEKKDEYELGLEEEEEEEETLHKQIMHPSQPSRHRTQRQPPSSSSSTAKTHTAAAKTHTVVDPIEFQKQQQHQLEIELSTLASRLKSSTLSIQSSLQNQTVELSQFEVLAQDNLDTVSNTAHTVQERLVEKRGWKKRLVTWSMVGVVVGSWIGCFMIIRMVPKRSIGEFGFMKITRRGSSSSSVGDDGRIRTSWFTMPSSLENLSFPSFNGLHELLFDGLSWSDSDDQDETTSWLDDDECQQHDNNDNCITDEMWKEQERLQEEMLHQLHNDEEKQRWNRQREEEWENTRQQHYHHHPQRQQRECEILSDGTQHCYGSSSDDEEDYYSSDRKAQEHAAERKRRRVLENMANAQEVNAVDVDDTAEEEDAARRREEESIRLQRQDEIGAEEEKRRRLEEEEAARRHREQIRLQREEEEVRAAAAAAEAKQQQEEAEHRRHQEEQIRLQRESQARAAAEEEMQRKQEAEARTRLEEAERNRQLEEATRLENEARAAAENIALKRQQQEEETAADLRRREELDRIQQEKYAAKVAAEQKEAAEKAEQVRLQKEADDKAAKEREIAERHRREMEAAAEAERLERERIDAIEREKQNIERVRKTASEEANAALMRARQVTFDAPSDNDALPSEIRFAAGRSKNDLLAHYISTHPDTIDTSDATGWRPIHEASRGGNLAGVQLLIDSGADLSAKTGRSGSGGTALWWAIQRYGEDSDVVRLLRSYNAPEDGPEL